MSFVVLVLLFAPVGPSGAQERSAESERKDGEDGPAVGDATVDPRPVDPSPKASSLPRPPPDVEILVVTGQRRRASVAEASQAATTFDAVELESLGVLDIGDLAPSTPSLEIRKAGSSTATFFIRGVGLNDFTANASGSVAIYQDDVPLNLPALQVSPIFDVRDVQVLKGPQGSGPGRNASAGAIKIASNLPTGEPSASLRFDYGNFNFIEAEGALEVPLLEDMLSTRVSFRLTKRDGNVRNRCGDLTLEQINADGGRPCGNLEAISNSLPVIVPGLPKWLNDTNIWAARAHLRFVPPETDMDWTLSVHASKLDQFGTVGQHLGARNYLGSADIKEYRAQEVFEEFEEILAEIPAFSPSDCNGSPFHGFPDEASCRANLTAIQQLQADTLAQSLADRPLDTEPFVGDYNFPGFERMTSYGGFLRGEWELPKVSLTSITGFERYARERNIDADYSPNVLFEFQIQDDAWQFSQDLRASGELDRYPVTWGSGGYFLIEELDFEQTTRAELRRVVDQFYVQKTTSFGVYGDFSWEFMDDLTLDGGVRYNWERKGIDAEVFKAGADKCVPTRLAFVIPQCSKTVTFSAPTGTLGLTYDFNDEVAGYWKYSRGWKGPQLNVRDGNPPSRVLDVALPESIDAFEVGLKGLWFEDRLSFEMAVFWYSYENYQVFVVTNDLESPPQRIVINANDAQIYGAEIEAGIEPFDSLDLQLRFGWLESKFLDFTDTGTRSTGGGPAGGASTFYQQVLDYNGNQLPNTPKFKLSGSAEYVLDLGRYGELVPRYDFSWTDDVFFDPSEGKGAPNITNTFILPENTIAQSAYALHNARLTYRSPSGEVSMALWVRNFTNELYKTTAFDLSTAANLVGSLVGNPRTYGLSVTVNY